MQVPKIEDFIYFTPYKVQWGDMDALGHVNNVVYIRYFETARVNFMEQSDLFSELLGDDITIVLARIECNFVQELKYPGEIKLMARIKSIGNSSMVVEHMVVGIDGKIYAFGDGTIVCTRTRKGDSGHTKMEKVSVPVEIRRKLGFPL